MITFGEQELIEFRRYLEEQECSPATVKKYAHDAHMLYDYTGGQIADKAQLTGYKNYLLQKGYSSRTINTMLGAANKFLGFMGAGWKLRYEKIQRQNFTTEDRSLSREEYEHLVSAAREKGNNRLALLILTLCSLGIRVSELKAITVESVRRGEAVIRNKGKIRVILIPDELGEQLSRYCQDRNIVSGCVFITRTGKPLDRSNIWKMMKRLSRSADVPKEKVFPHNLRHLFARLYYKKYQDIVRLADILGHSSIDTTRIYTCHSGREERRQMSELRLVI